MVYLLSITGKPGGIIFCVEISQLIQKPEMSWFNENMRKLPEFPHNVVYLEASAEGAAAASLYSKP